MRDRAALLCEHHGYILFLSSSYRIVVDCLNHQDMFGRPWPYRDLSRNVIANVIGLVEQTETHVLILGLLLLLLLGLLLGGRSAAGGSTTGGGGSGGVLVGVGNAVLELGDLVPLVVGLDGDGEDLLVGVDNGVHDRRQSGVAESQRNSGNGGDGGGEGLEELVLADVQNGSIEGLTVVVDLVDTHTVGEGRDVQQVEQSSLGSSDLATGLDELQVGGNFNGTTGNLGRDTESLEERGLSGFHTTVHLSIGYSRCMWQRRSYVFPAGM
jgi:hypothetical protein